ncbi:hypothetical protein CWRG_02194, partial [Chthonomonas calidirosea]
MPYLAFQLKRQAFCCPLISIAAHTLPALGIC